MTAAALVGDRRDALAEQRGTVGILDLYAHYLRCPLSPTRFVGATVSFTVSGEVYDDFSRLMDELGWDIIGDRAPASAPGDGVVVTVRRRIVTNENSHG